MRFQQTDFTIVCPICKRPCVYVTTTYSHLAGQVIVAHGNSCGCRYTEAQAAQVQEHAKRAYYDVVQLAIAEAGKSQ